MQIESGDARVRCYETTANRDPQIGAPRSHIANEGEGAERLAQEAYRDADPAVAYLS